MNAQQIIQTVNQISWSGLRLNYEMIPENRALLDEIYEVAKAVEPCDKYRDGNDRDFWLWADRGSFEDFAVTFKDWFTYGTIYELLDGEGGETRYDEMQEKWPKMFPEERVWFHLYLAEHDGNRGVWLYGRRIIDTRESGTQMMDMSELLEWILEAEKKCVEMIKEGTYSDFIVRNLPYKHRSGVTDLATYWKC